APPTPRPAGHPGAPGAGGGKIGIWVLLCLGIGLWGGGPVCSADQLAEVLARGTIVWGGDQEGGGPYVFPDEQGKQIGFEVELAGLLAQEIGRQQQAPRELRAVFQQGQWVNLPLMLNNQIDLVLNGYELTPDRQRDYLCSRPYYMYGLQLMARKSLAESSWEELKASGKKYTAGVLVGSAAAQYLQKSHADYITVIEFDGNTDALQKVQDGLLDLTLLDDCAALHYADRFTQVKFISRPVGQGYFVILVKQGEDRLLKAVNAALDALLNNGELKSLYDRWDMSGKAQMLVLRDTTHVASAATQSLWDIIRLNLPLLLEGAGYTVLLACASMPLAIAMGVLVALGRLYGPRWLAWLCAWYVEIIRGTPLLLQLYAIFFLLPELGINLHFLVAGIAGLALNYSAYEAEIYRAGLQSVPRGQMEAALALGLTRQQAIWRIILPQAMRIVIPPVTNDFIALFKDTSVCSAITIMELTKRYTIQANSTGAFMELAAITAILYLLMSYPLSLLARWSEARLGANKN
ncbi:MAG: ABC transporter permease subunit, partial [Pirellulales bacterium]|nr:ABC transporter permease subunit [Pirellulales bacterium]